MAASTIRAPQSLIKVKRVEFSDTVTLNADGYLKVQSYIPSGMNNFLFAMVETWSSQYPKAAFGITSTGAYLIGSANMTISGLKLRYYYTD